MKSVFNIYIIVLLILFNALTSYSDNKTNLNDSKEKNKSELLSNEFLIDSIYVYQQDNSIAKNYIKYHSNLEVASRLYEYWQDDELQRRVYNTYDENGNNIYKLSEKYENGVLDISERRTKTFNSNNQMTSIINEDKRGNREWEIIFTEMRTYNSEGNTTRTYKENWTWNTIHSSTEYLYAFDENGNQIFRSYEFIYEGTQFDYETNQYSYNSNGQILTSENNEWEFEKLVKKIKYTYSYNENDLKINELYEAWNNDDTEFKTKITYIYDDFDRIISKIVERFINDEWIVIEEEEHSYDERNNIIRLSLKKMDNNKLIEHKLFEDEFDERNNHIYSSYQIFEKDTLTNAYLNWYKYDNDNNKISTSTEWFYDNKWILMSESESTYYENNKMKTHFRESWDENNSEISNLQYYTFDENGNETSFLFIDKEKDIQTNDRKGSRIFDENSNLLSSVYYKWINEKWVKENRRQYDYNNNFDLLTFLEENFDNNDNLISSKRSTYTYTEGFKPLTYLYEELTDNIWQSQNRYFYTYDTDGLLTNYYREYWQDNEWHNDHRTIPITFPDVIDYAVSGYRMDIFWNNQTISVFEQDSTPFTQAFPNPASNSITVKYENAQLSNLNIRIIDNLTKEYICDYAVNNDEILINIDKLPIGVYFILINHGNKTELRKFIKINN